MSDIRLWKRARKYFVGMTVIWMVLTLALRAMAQESWSAPSYLNVVEEECDDDFQAVFSFKLADKASGRLKILINASAGRGYHLTLNAQRLGLAKFTTNHAIVLGFSEPLRLKHGDATNQLVIKRRDWKITAICNGEICLVCYDDELRGGKLSYAVDGKGITVENARYQPIEAVYFSDDFMRGVEDAQHWQVRAGQWQPIGADAPSQKFDPNLSANPYSYQVTADDKQPALATAGYWFWDSYTFEVSVRPRSQQGAVGIAAYVQDPHNYLLFRWSRYATPTVSPPSEREGREGVCGVQQLVKVVDGKQEVLAQRAGGYVPMQWYRLGLRVRDDEMQAFVDDKLVLRAKVSLFGRGKVGLYADSGAAAQFDDVKVESSESLIENFDRPLQGRWSALNGKWQAMDGCAVVDGRQERKGHSRHFFVAKSSPRYYLTTGSTRWRDYVVGASVKTQNQCGVGLAFNFLDSSNYYLIRWGSEKAAVSYQGKKQLIAVVNGKERILSESSGSLPLGKWYRLKVESESGLIQAYINGEPVLSAADWSLPTGKIALFAEGSARVAFQDVVVYFLPPKSYAPKLTTQFTKEQTMEGWASGRGSWAMGQDGTYWHKADFMGKLWLQTFLPPPKQFNSALTLICSANGRSSDTGYHLTVSGDGSGKLILSLRRAGEEVAREQTVFEVDQRLQLDLQREGTFLIALLNEKPILHFRDPQPLTGRSLGLKSNGVPIDFDTLQAACSNMVDDTFSVAPTDWWVQRGAWEVTERWTCSPQWSFFGGMNSAAPVLWSKKSFKGDVTVEAYISIRMHDEGYKYPGDLNVSICGDGINLDSGYSFIFAGWGNTCSRILKGDRVLAERKDQVGIIPVPIKNYHRYWWYLRVQRQGNKLRMFVDDNLVAEAEDPNPLNEGRVAIWTLNKGILIARARIWYEKLGTLPPLLEAVERVYAMGLNPPPTRKVEMPADGNSLRVIGFDFERDAGEFQPGGDGEGKVFLRLDTSTAARGKSSLKVVNALPGGRFEVKGLTTPFDALKLPILRFAYRVPSDVKVNLRLRVNGNYHVIVFTGGNEIKGGYPVIGAIPNVTTDDAWHYAEFNLKDALTKFYPSGQQILVDEIIFANLNPDTYLYAGIGGNHFGSAYYLDDFTLSADGAKMATSKD